MTDSRSAPTIAPRTESDGILPSTEKTAGRTLSPGSAAGAGEVRPPGTHRQPAGDHHSPAPGTGSTAWSVVRLLEQLRDGVHGVVGRRRRRPVRLLQFPVHLFAVH